LETPVAEFVPEFGTGSRETTVQHLLTHTAGLVDVETGWPAVPWDTIIHRICAAGVQNDWVAGRRAAYDPQRSWFLLGEIIRRLTGRPVEAVVREDLLLPLAMPDSWLAMPPAVHQEYGDRIGRTYDVHGPRQEPTGAHRLPFCTAASPGSSARGPIGDLRRFYEMLLAGGATPEGRPLLQPASVALMVQRHREGMYDETFRHTLDFGLGVIINSRRYGPGTVPYGYGLWASEETFGHGGARSCIAFADPRRELVLAMLANGYLPEPRHQERMRRLLEAVYDDLGMREDPPASEPRLGIP
jgi:CubicO group peptidase (beta-lactamase class C family)